MCWMLLLHLQSLAVFKQWRITELIFNNISGRTFHCLQERNTWRHHHAAWRHHHAN
eukprot:NODE_3415_length_932_cov_4.055493_g2844_i0.p3 GENE.NODE_3415_length_932_cov_4.055493_g2844_i0~~NODE_3415_length_932_cov_4.055493_g2844_i0.p3  ORF type:complete len:56 (+),score=12.54 NODE_3415_length_932_cov_4.055493_g2844_i0:111-278(+)